MTRNGPYFLLAAGLVALDQATKNLVASKVALYRSIPVIPGFFNITRIHNKGAIFGTFSQTGNPLVFVLLTAASLLALAFVVYYFFKTPAADKLMKFALTLIMAGAVGNQFDRLVRGHVIDFLDFYIGQAHWPFFNAADSCITIGACLMLIVLFRRKPACSPSS
ncbi:MAG TPA: signal peptidase II [Candidatus Aminicenantes bacterium]|nr:signal peptidase II [Candidatus Aminicenantes bacterium]HRY65551.1 signal peptidase II [Candidatus Aminicenantes bacterium]HRZ72561.1 signal peptidase II [Candidatus Aminicenantes bacterium]